MKKIINLCLFIILAVSMCACTPEQTIRPVKKEPQKELEKASKESIKIFAIGNSFSDNAMSYLYPILKAFGAKEVVLGNMYIGGCSLETHANNAQNNNPIYAFRKNDSREATAGSFVTKASTMLLEGLVDEEWQYVTLQQASGVSGVESSYEKFANALNQYVRMNATNPQVKVGWHQTWAYQANSTHSEFVNYQNNQEEMYKSIVNCVKNKIANNHIYDFIIPAGTAIQNARTSYVKDTLTIDGYHLNSLGEFIIGLTWVLEITNWDINDLDINKIPGEFREDIEMIKEVAKAAYNNKLEITSSQYLEKPIYEIDYSKYFLLEWQPTIGFWNSQSSIDLLINDSISYQFVSSGVRFTKDELPIGTIIEVDEGYGYRPEGWTNKDETNKATRPGNVTTKRVYVDELWWGNYEVRAFNVYKTPNRVDMTNLIPDVQQSFRIYIPKTTINN